MPIYLETQASLALSDGDFIDLYAGNPRTGLQPMQSVTFNATTPNLTFTGIDLALAYTLVHRAGVTFKITLTPNVGPG